MKKTLKKRPTEIYCGGLTLALNKILAIRFILSIPYDFAGHFRYPFDREFHLEQNIKKIAMFFFFREALKFHFLYF